MLPLHIHVGLIKISVKAVDKESEGFASLRQNFFKMSGAKMKEGIFFGPQITQILEYQAFSSKLNSTEIRTWKAYENICRNFIGNEHANNCTETVQELILPYGALECSLSLKLHFLHSHLDFLPPENMGAVSDEHGERFYQDISEYQETYSGKWSPNMLADYCWSLIRKTLTGENKRQKKTK